MDILISGASTGIGRACAVHMARLGNVVWAGVRSQNSFDEISRLNVKGLRPVILDVANSDSIASAVSEIRKRSGMLSGLVNNAGVAVGGPIEALTMKEWHHQFQVNFFGVVELTRECLPLLRESKGRIVNMSSISGRIATPFLGPYASSKFALEAFSDSLRRELRSHAVRVSVIEPGAIKTPIWEKSLSTGSRARAELSGEMEQVYGPSLNRFFKYLDELAANGGPVSLVTKAVEHALCSSSPRSRYPVGRGIKTLSRLTGWLPDSLIDRLLRANP